MTTRRPTTARLLAGLAPFLLVGLSLPLMAPSCGDYTPGVKTFAKGSLIIPMDVCYQCTVQQPGTGTTTLDTATGKCTTSTWSSAPSGNLCPQQVAKGDVIKAYGLVYQLIRNNVPVYWVIDGSKTAVDGYDLAIQFNAGFPASKLDWVSGQPSAVKPTSGSIIRYMGGPFVVDGSDADKALAVMRSIQATFGVVNVHVASVAFQASVAKTMAGGWDAGGARPPKLALLDIGSGILSASGTSVGTVKNSEPIIRGYLARAGLDVAGAGGVAGGPHGLIYDRLTAADFLPTAGGDWTTSNLGRIATDPTNPGAYQILWVPHWAAPGSCTDYSSSSACYSTLLDKSVDAPVVVPQILRTIGSFEANGHDVFAECAGLGSFEGHAVTSSSAAQSPAGYSRDYRAGDASTRFQTTAGLDLNKSVAAAQYGGNYASPFLQVGDYAFIPVTGAIQNYRSTTSTLAPLAGAAWRPETVRLVSDASDASYAYFTVRPRAGSAGSAVYLGGHAYSGYSDSLNNGQLQADNANYQVAGSRLVLNTLFNLGAGCVDSNVECSVPGKYGECAKGLIKCQAGLPTCTQVTFPTPEICDGKDNDCNGAVDDMPDQDCYSGPPATKGVGLCRGGTRTCQYDPVSKTYGLSACQGEVTPTTETCNGLDDDCDGYVDNAVPGAPAKLSESCYTGPVGTLGVGTCHGGTHTCDGAAGWGACTGEVTPLADPCASPEGAVAQDRNCDGVVENCTPCVFGVTLPKDCYTGPPSTLGVGPCKAGKQACLAGGEWSSECTNQVLPQAEVCNDGIDQACHGDLTGEGTAAYPTPGTGQPNTGHDGPPYCMGCKFVAVDAQHPTEPDLARTEQRACWTGRAGVVFDNGTNKSVCKQGTEYCQADGLFGACTGQGLPGPELCNDLDDDCNGIVNDGATCGAGFSCENGVCVASSCGPETPCRDGYVCTAGQCKLSTCCRDPECTSITVCDVGFVCVSGSGTNPCVSSCDPAAIHCGAPDYCAGGFCTGGGCYAVGCPGGGLCRNGECVADACSGVTCPGGTFCRQGDCVQACAFITCGPSEQCDADGFCVADPCVGKSCSPSQKCSQGACVPDACIGVACGGGQVCQDGGCVDDPCAGVTCPTGQCRDGQCFATHPAAAVAGPAGDGGSSGCGCGNGSGSPLALLGLLLALPLARRRRGRHGGHGGHGGAGLAVLAAAGLVAGAGCTRSTPAPPFDPASCAALAVPLDTCPGENRCVDLFNDPSHCGSCDRVCGAGNWCVDKVCGPATAVAPHLSAVSPSTASVGGLGPVPVTLTGDRLVAGSTLRATSPTGTVTVPTTLGAGQLTAALDLTGATPGVWALRVVSPERVISNALAFGVSIPTPLVTRVEPVPDGGPNLTPPAVPAGSGAHLVLHGSGFMVGSSCWIRGTTLQAREVPAELVSTGGETTLDCTLDLSGVQPGPTFSVWVVNDDTHKSSEAPFQVRSASARLDSISPQHMNLGASTSVKGFGVGFDITSKIWLSGPGLTTQAINTSLDSSTQLTMTALDLAAGGVCGAGACPITDTTHHYYLEVCNGCSSSSPPTGLSGRQELYLEVSGRTINGIVPTFAAQGSTTTVTASGSGLAGTGPSLEYLPSGATTWRVAANQVVNTASAPNTVKGDLDLVNNPAGTVPAGACEVRVRFSDGSTSASYTLRIDSNQAIIMAPPSPAFGPAGTAMLPVTLTVSNLQPPLASVKVRFYDPTVPAPPSPFTVDLTPTAISQTGLNNVTVQLPLSGLQTEVYALSVINPNYAPASLPRNFTVSPGVPTVTGLACTSVPPAAGALCDSATSARQQVQPVPIHLSGTNFALPDAAGLNGSEVRISSAAVGVTDYRLPPAAVTVVSSTGIDVQLDTTLAVLQGPSGAQVPTTYTVQVWNQGGAQRSTTFATGFTIKP